MRSAAWILAILLGLVTSCRDNEQMLRFRAPALVVEVQAGIGAGARHTCARLEDATVWCWGSNVMGEIGQQTSQVRFPYPVRVPGLSAPAQLALGRAFTCVRNRAGTVWCFGANQVGQLGDGTRQSRASPAPLADLGAVLQMGVGAHHACAVVPDRTVRCWGNNSSEQVGFAGSRDVLSPVAVPDLDGVESLALGVTHSCALRTDGTVWCWGNNDVNQLGDGTSLSRAEPRPVPGLTRVVALSAGGGHTCALLDDGAVWCWGSNLGGQLGAPDPDERGPIAVPGLSATSVALGSVHSCALTTDGTVRCWGSGVFGQLGNGQVVDRKSAGDVADLAAVRQIAVGDLHGCALDAAGDVLCWGRNDQGQLGDGTLQNRCQPVPVRWSEIPPTAETGGACPEPAPSDGGTADGGAVDAGSPPTGPFSLTFDFRFLGPQATATIDCAAAGVVRTWIRVFQESEPLTELRRTCPPAEPYRIDAVSGGVHFELKAYDAADALCTANLASVAVSRDGGVECAAGGCQREDGGLVLYGNLGAHWPGCR